MEKDQKIIIYRLTEINESNKNISKHINDLIRVLTPKKIRVNKKRIEELLNNPLIEIHFLEIGGRVAGMGTIYYMETLVKKAAWLEDIVVHPAYQGKGLGKKIMEHLIAKAKKKGVKHMDVSSRHDRKGSDKFYQKLDFEKRNSSIYRLYAKGKK